MKRPLAGVITVILMGGLLWAGARRPTGNRSIPTPVVTAATAAEPAHPAEGRIQSLMECAGRGDVSAYLDAFTGPLRARLDREVSERGPERFAGDLTSASARRKSHAVFAAEADGPGAASVVVESVYPDRNERQAYRVEQQPEGGWLVTAVETVKSLQPEAKFGAAASFLAPEGVPVQGSGAGLAGDGPDAPPGPN